MKKERLTEKQAIFGEVLHTGFRKALDGTASSICWNAINLMDNKDWNEFVAIMSSRPLTRKVCAAAIEYGESGRNLFKIGLEMLTDEEYRILADWIKDCM